MKKVTCVAVDIGLDICVSGSNDGTCIVHDLRHGNYVRSIYHPNNLPINLVCVSPLGHVVFFSRMVFFSSINLCKLILLILLFIINIIVIIIFNFNSLINYYFSIMKLIK